MVKFSAYSLMILSFTPFHSIILKNPRRFSRNIPFNHSTKSRVTSYAQNVQLHTEDMMGASRYLPPLFSVAPMMEWTDNHYRTLARLISKHAWLYTEMLAAETIVYQQGNLVTCVEQEAVLSQEAFRFMEKLGKIESLQAGKAKA
ncbi:hypothetical protein E1A91_D13G126200v1 [Gossypium mustelinum]|uniref:DUS-like FMN-binding domain-containing protein n=2 Tax=Gossypium TaxID=3633 RepID=A0A5D2S365_GOSMU|nr:hypothetical protein E1A91_D13G126200v1 [Gossypium mustelinum]